MVAFPYGMIRGSKLLKAGGNWEKGRKTKNKKRFGGGLTSKEFWRRFVYLQFLLSLQPFKSFFCNFFLLFSPLSFGGTLYLGLVL